MRPPLFLTGIRLYWLLLTVASVFLYPTGLHARDRVSVGVSISSGPVGGCYRPYGPPYYPRPNYGFSYSYSQVYPVYPAPVYAVPAEPYYYPAPPAPVYYGKPVPSPTYSVSYAPRSINGQVLQVQSALRRKKYYRGALDGISGPETQNAIRSYQIDRGLPVTGRIDSEFLSDLGQ